MGQWTPLGVRIGAIWLSCMGLYVLCNNHPSLAPDCPGIVRGLARVEVHEDRNQGPLPMGRGPIKKYVPPISKVTIKGGRQSHMPKTKTVAKMNQHTPKMPQVLIHDRVDIAASVSHVGCLPMHDESKQSAIYGGCRTGFFPLKVQTFQNASSFRSGAPPTLCKGSRK